VKEVCQKGMGHLDADTYTTEFTFDAATTAVGSLIDLTNEVCSGRLKNGFALVRPPGHHALAENGMGFCIFGNVAIASKAAIKNFKVKKAAIVDIDVHHGNGTQELIGNNPNILFISTHQYPFYPGTGAINEIGTSEAKGTIINILLQPHTNDESFKIIYEEIIIPALKKFKPEIIFVSAGYDSHWKDPLANMGLSLNGYSWISKKLVETAEEICSGKIVFTLEGGYNLDILATGVLNSIKAMMGEINFEDPFGLSPHQSPDVSDLVNQLKQIHSL
jgi:acetoin utilization deacetylase AcuC-like enzyme